MKKSLRYPRETFVLGLTGSIGMGKTLVTKQFEALGAKVCHADAIVHHLLSNDTALIGSIGDHFKGALGKGGINREVLAAAIFQDHSKRKTLEQLIHPSVVAAENAFIRKESRKGTRLVVLDIPLLFETGAEKRCDAVVVVTAPSFVQKRRVLMRSGMTEAKFALVQQAQWPDRKKRRRADAIIQTGLGRRYSFRAVQRLMEEFHAA